MDTLIGMSTLAEIEAVIPSLTPDELALLERSVRAVRHRKENPLRLSVFDLPPLQLGEVLRPLCADDNVLGEMLGDTRF